MVVVLGLGDGDGGGGRGNDGRACVVGGVRVGRNADGDAGGRICGRG